MLHMMRFFAYTGSMPSDGSYCNLGCGTFVEREVPLEMDFHRGYRNRILQVLRYTLLERNQEFLDRDVIKFFQLFRKRLSLSE